MTMTESRPLTMKTDLATEVDQPIPVTRRRVDHVLIALGVAAAMVMAVAGGLLTWGNGFAEDYVSDELSAQQISFPPSDVLVEEGRGDLAAFGGAQVTTGEHAEAYASYIGGHLAHTADGLTYSQIDDRSAAAAVEEAEANGAPEAEVTRLQAEADELTDQRNTVFKGEMLRGTLLNAFAWSTMGRIAGIAATVAFVGAAVMALLSAAGVVHLRKVSAAS